MTAGGGEGGVSHLRSDAFKGGEGVRGLEVDRTKQSREFAYCLDIVSSLAIFLFLLPFEFLAGLLERCPVA